MAWRVPSKGQKPGFGGFARPGFGSIAFDIPIQTMERLGGREPVIETEAIRPVDTDKGGKPAVIQSVTEIFRPPVESREEEDMEIEESDCEAEVTLEDRMRMFEEEEKQTEEKAKRTVEVKRMVCRRLRKRGLPPAKDFREEEEIEELGDLGLEGIEPGEILEAPIHPIPLRSRSRSRSPPPKPASPPFQKPQRPHLSFSDRLTLQQTLMAQLCSLPSQATPPPSPPHQPPVLSSLSTVKPEEDLFALSSDDDMFAKTPDRDSDDQTGAGEALQREKLDDLDDGEGYYLPQIGEVFVDDTGGRRFVVQQVLGKGVYSCVVRVLEPSLSQQFAIKIIRSHSLTLQSGITEIKVLSRLSELDPFNHKHTIQSYGSFRHQSHICVVFEDMEFNLREVIRKHGEGVGLSMAGVKSYARQMMHALLLLKQAKLLHCDLKPDNILITKDLRKIKVADFGSVIGLGETVQTDLLVARYYRAPEIVLGAPLDSGIDMWSIACTIFELYTGSILFPGSTNGELLRLIMDVIGPIPKRIRNRGQFSARYFDPISFVYTVASDPQTGEKVVSVPLTELKRTKSLYLMIAAKATEEEKGGVKAFADMMEKALEVDTKNRLTPERALAHPFFQA